jgi:DNA polymerase-1
MNNPNLQQLPGKDIKNQQRRLAMKRIYALLGVRSVPQHRRAFIARPGYSLISGDFSGQEMAIMAAAAGEDLWINALLRGDDIHALTASLLYGQQWTDAAEEGCCFPKKCGCRGHAELREPTKILNFMLAYGGGHTKLSKDTGMPLLEARVLVNKYRKVVPNVTAWLKANGQDGAATGVSFSADPYRRRRVLKGQEDWELVNQGKNNPVQSAGANMLKLAMISVPDEYAMVLVIHDEIVLEVKNCYAKQAAKVLKKVMEDAATYCTGIKGLVKVEPRISQTLYKEDNREPVKKQKDEKKEKRNIPTVGRRNNKKRT